MKIENRIFVGERFSKLPAHVQKSFSAKNKPLYNGGRRTKRCTCECYQLGERLKMKSSLYSTMCILVCAHGRNPEVKDL